VYCAWYIEEFFNAHQDLGWKRAGTLNLNIRYGQMTMALIAQAALARLRRRLGPPLQTWDAVHLAKGLLGGLEGDIRVQHGTVIVTYYNAPYAHRLRPHYEGLPDLLAKEHIDPRIPWLFDLKLDFRFR
jgi:hypothetical protein